LGGRQVHCFDASDQGHVDPPGQIDLIVAGKVLLAENVDRYRVERRDPVVLLDAQRARLVRRRKRYVIRDGTTRFVGAGPQRKHRGQRRQQRQFRDNTHLHTFFDPHLAMTIKQ
jgi:hypothetical protein